MILLLYPRRGIEEWVESNLPSLTAPHSSWVGLRLENSNLNLASRRLTQPLAVSSFSVQQPSHSESLVRAGWLMGQLSRGTFCQGEGSSLLPARRCQGHHGKHTHTHTHTHTQSTEARRGGRGVGRGWGNLHKSRAQGLQGLVQPADQFNTLLPSISAWSKSQCQIPTPCKPHPQS